MSNAPSLSHSLRNAILALVLASATLLAYRPAWHGGYLWDDDVYLTKNTLLTAPDGLKRIWFSLDSPSQYFPLTYTTFRIERSLWGLNPTGYHWSNILLHAANALLLWRLLRRLAIPGAWLAAFIFALHPVQVESVAWITERKNVLMGFFFLLSLIAWAKFLEPARSHRWIYYGAALVCYLVALSAKTTACTLPGALFLILWLRKIRIDWRRALQIVPFVVFGVLMGLITIWWERYHQGTRGDLFALGFADRILIASRAFWFYLGKLFWPANLTFIYPKWGINPASLPGYSGLAALIILAALICFVRRKAGRGPEVAFVFFAATLAPVLGFIMLYTFRYTYVADHYQYLACLGPIALVSAALSVLARFTPYPRGVSIGAGVLISGIFALLTWRQAQHYRDAQSLWTDTLAKNPECWMAYNNLGIDLFEQGREAEAIANYQRALELEPEYAATHYNLANALLRGQRVEESLEHARRAVQLRPNDPDSEIALGNSLLASDRVPEARTAFIRAVELRPRDPEGWYGLGRAEQAAGNLAAAAGNYEKALYFAPDLFEPRLNLGNVLFQLGREADSLQHYERALLVSGHAVEGEMNLAWALSSATRKNLRDGDRAVRLAEDARNRQPRDAVVLHILAAAYAQKGDFERARQTVDEALSLAQAGPPNDSLVHELKRGAELYRQNKPFEQP